MLRSHVNQYHSDWPKHIPALLYAYHNIAYSSTGVTPNKLVFGCCPRDIRAPLTEPAFGHKVGDLIKISTRTLESQASSTHVKKLQPKFLGPCMVTELFGSSVRVSLSDSFHSLIHDSFNASDIPPTEPDGRWEGTDAAAVGLGNALVFHASKSVGLKDGGTPLVENAREWGHSCAECKRDTASKQDRDSGGACVTKNARGSCKSSNQTFPDGKLYHPKKRMQ